jgi:hypothetical protein
MKRKPVIPKKKSVYYYEDAEKILIGTANQLINYLGCLNNVPAKYADSNRVYKGGIFVRLYQDNRTISYYDILENKQVDDMPLFEFEDKFNSNMRIYQLYHSNGKEWKAKRLKNIVLKEKELYIELKRGGSDVQNNKKNTVS